MSDVQTIILDLLRRADFGEAEVDVSSLNGYLPGLVIADRTSIRNTIEAVQAVFQIDSVESNGTLKFTYRGKASVAGLTEADLLPLNDQGENGRELYVIAMAAVQGLPQRVDVIYYDRILDYQSNTQQGLRQSAPATTVASVNAGFVLDATVAKQAADMLLDTAWTERYSFQFALGLTYAYLEPGDVVTLTIQGRAWVLRLVRTKLTRTAIEIEAVTTDADTYRQVNVSSSHESPSEVIIAGATYLYALDIPLVETDSDAPRYFVAGGKERTDTKWRYSTVWDSTNNTDFATVTTIGTECIHGTATTILPAPVQSVYWDESSTVTVTLIDGTLQSITERQMLDGGNVAVLGDEIIQFQNAALVSPNTYTLSRLLRGRRGTEAFMGTHTAGERFIILGEEVLSVDMTTSDIAVPLYLRGVSNGRVLEDTVSVNLTPRAANLKPFSVSDLEATFSGGGDMTITWKRRTRYSGEWLDYVDVPLSEIAEAYEVDILNGSTVVRTISTNSPSALYTNVQQTADFGSGQSVVSVVVYQLSGIVGRGFPAPAVLSNVTACNGTAWNFACYENSGHVLTAF